VARCGVVMTSARGEAAPRRGKVGDDISWADANLTRPKMNKIHMIDPASING
jgi:hypothetical protein